MRFRLERMSGSIPSFFFWTREEVRRGTSAVATDLPLPLGLPLGLAIGSATAPSSSSSSSSDMDRSSWVLTTLPSGGAKIPASPIVWVGAAFHR